MTLLVHKKFTFNGTPYAKGEEFSEPDIDPRRFRQLIDGRFVLEIEGDVPEARAKPKRGRGRPKGAKTRRRKVARKPVEQPALVPAGGDDEDPMAGDVVE